MEPQSETIKIDATTAAKLREQAAARGITLEEFLRSLTEDVNGDRAIKEPSVDEFMEAMESLVEDNIKPLPRDFSCEDIYSP